MSFMGRFFSQRNLRWLFPLSIFIIVLGIYSYTAGRVNLGYADSDELITTGYLLGVPHPSGYPLQVILIHLFLQLPVSGSPAFKAHLLSSVLQALTVVLAYFIGLELIGSQPKSKPHLIAWQHLASAAGALVLGFSALFWLYASVIEVGALNNLFAALTILSALYWRKSAMASKQEKKLTALEFKWLVLTSLLVGLGMSHLHVFALLFPGLLLLGGLTIYLRKKWLVYWRWQPVIISLAAALAGFILPNLLLFWLNAKKAAFSWAFSQNFWGWYGMITRKDFSGFIPDKGINVSAYGLGTSKEVFFQAISQYPGFLIAHFTYLGVILGLLGAIWLFKKRLYLGCFWLVCWLVAGVWFAGRLGLPENTPQNLEYRTLIGINHRQYLLGELIWGLAIGVGFWWLGSAFLHRFKSQLFSYILLLGLLILAAYPFVENFSIANQRDNSIVHQYAVSVLNSVEDNAVILCFADVSCFSLFYEQQVEGLRPDVTLLIKNSHYRRYFLETHPQYRGFTYQDNPYFSADLTSWNLHYRPTYITEASAFYIDYLGLEGNPFFLIPHGYLYQVVTRVPDQIGEFDYQPTADLIAMHIDPRNYLLSGFKDYLANFHTLTGTIYAYLGNHDQARKNYAYATSLSPRYPEPARLLSQLSAYQGKQDYQTGSQGKSSQEYLAQAKKLIDQFELDQAYKLLLKATFLEPLAVEPRWQLVQVYEKGGFFQEALQEVKNILQYHPDFQPAVDELKHLEDNI